MKKTFFGAFVAYLISGTSAFGNEGTVGVVANNLTPWVNYLASALFAGAILHTFLTVKIQHYVEHFSKRYVGDAKPFWLQIAHFFGEVEVVFGLWVVPLMLVLTLFSGWNSAVNYISTRHYTEPLFVIVIMCMASSKPILKAAEFCLKFVAILGKETVSAWWMAILIFAPLLGSLITEPGAMTIAASLLAKKCLDVDDTDGTATPSRAFRYATLGLLFVNVSIGGTLTHFAAPPVLMIARTWNWSTLFMLKNFGWIAILTTVLSTTLYRILFRKELKRLNFCQKKSAKRESMNLEPAIPPWVIGIHIIFLLWTVMNAHYIPLLVGGFLFFLAFVQSTPSYQERLKLRESILVGFFLSGLVIHGGLQTWWIEPLIGRASEAALFYGSTVLTAFNDNAAITYLASLVPSFAGQLNLQTAVVAGAVTGGGLTVIANAPNPAGQALLARYFHRAISPLWLFLGALPPTLIIIICFRWIGH